MSSLLPPFPHLLPGFGGLPPISAAAGTPPGVATDIRKMAQSQPPSASPLLSAASKSSEPQFSFNAAATAAAAQQNKHKEKYACKYCGKVNFLQSKPYAGPGMEI